MRFWVSIFLLEAALLGLVIAISYTRTHHEAAHETRPVAPGVHEHTLQATHGQDEDAFALAFRSALNGLDRRLNAEEKASALGLGMGDAILRMEGIFDPTRIGLFGPAMRLQVRPGTASMVDVFGDRWTRASAEPNLHRRVAYIALGWLRPRAGSCDNFWMFRRNESPVMIDKLTPLECLRLRARDDTVAPVVAARLSLPAFAAPYPGNRLSSADLRAEQAAHIQATLQKQWFRRQSLSPLSGLADAGRPRQALFGRKASMTAGSVSTRAAPIKSRQ